MKLNDKKIVVAIENAVCEQLEASGINTDPFRLDGEKIVDVILERLKDFVLVPKDQLKTWAMWEDDHENIYRDSYSESICDHVAPGEVFKIKLCQWFDAPDMWVVPIYEDSDEFEYMEFDSEDLANKAAAENKAMIEAAQEKGNV